jgi:hypothetical protein
MKPILKDNICRGSIKKKLFLKTSFFEIFINRPLGDNHSLNFTHQHPSITNFYHLIFILVSFFTSLKTFPNLISRLNISNVYIQQCIPMEG